MEDISGALQQEVRDTHSAGYAALAQCAQNVQKPAESSVVVNVPQIRLSASQSRPVPSPLVWSGVGLHQGNPVSVQMWPGEWGQGIWFVWPDGEKLKLEPHRIEISQLCTLLGRGLHSVQTIEHLMAALWAARVTDVSLLVQGGEIPIMDGSAHAFYESMHQDKAWSQGWGQVSTLHVAKRTRVEGSNDSWIEVEPQPYLSIDVSIDFAHPLIGTQNASYSEKKDPSRMLFAREFLPARTFGLVDQLESLRARGLALGADRTNCLAFDSDTILTPGGKRFANECARHKLMDLVGDLYTSGHNVVAKIRAHKPSHALSNKLLRTLIDSSSATHLN